MTSGSSCELLIFLMHHRLDVYDFSSYKKHFECAITPRSRDHRQLIETVNTSNA